MKRILSLFIAVLVLIGTLAPIGAHAETKTNISLEKAISIAKDAFNLKTEGFELNYSYVENQDNKNIWRLTWDKAKAPSANISVSVDADNGDILNMYQWESSNKTQSKIPAYSKAQAQKVAENIATKLQAINFKLMQLDDKATENQEPYFNTGSDYNFTFIRIVNGIKMKDNGISISIDKNTLKLRNYTYNWDNGEFPAVSKAMSLDDAKKILMEKQGIELSYNLVYNYTTKTIKPILVYSLKNGNNPIDAITGEIIKNSVIIRYGLDKAANQTSMKDSGLTPQEQSTVDLNSKLISKEAAIEVAKKYIAKAIDYKLENANLYINEMTKASVWNINFSKPTGTDEEKFYLYASVDANNSDLLSFNLSEEASKEELKSTPNYSEAQAKNIAEQFIKSIQAKRFSTSEYRQNTSILAPGEYPETYNFSYIGKQNDAYCPFNNFNITINSQTGAIISYNMDWIELSLPSTEGTMKLEDAYKSLFGNLDFSLQYIKKHDYTTDAKSEIKLAYVLENFSGNLDAKTGVEIDYNGKPVTENKIASFTDIAGTAAEKDIQLLSEMGIITAGNYKYNPNEKLLQKDFVKMIALALDPYVVNYTESDDEYEKYYNVILQNKILSEKEKLPNAQISRQIAAKMLVRALNVGFVGDLSDIYVLSFKDAKSVGTQYKGYVAIAAKLNILTAEKDYINPQRHVLRGEAATMLVNFLKVDTNVQE